MNPPPLSESLLADGRYGSIMAYSDEDVVFMTKALEVAERGRGKVRPNPIVGCVLVKDGDIIAEGWHDHLGGLHAEQMAIHDAEAKGHNTNGATAYVTLEPCNHFGRTPPCTESLLWAGVSEVIIAHSDPNPNVRGDGTSVLEEAGIKVRTGLLEQEAATQMREFLHWCEYRRPFVTVKVAIDSNGSVDDRSQEAGRFTSQECLVKVHELRDDCDAILIGVETVLRDDPTLNVRHVECLQQPLRFIIDPNGRCPIDCKLLNDGGDTVLLEEGFRGLPSMLDMMGDMEIQRLLVEGGPTTINHFLNEGLVDEFILIQAEIEHVDPLLAEFDLSGFENHTEEKWGDERVLIHTA